METSEKKKEFIKIEIAPFWYNKMKLERTERIEKAMSLEWNGEENIYPLTFYEKIIKLIIQITSAYNMYGDFKDMEQTENKSEKRAKLRSLVALVFTNLALFGLPSLPAEIVNETVAGIFGIWSTIEFIWARQIIKNKKPQKAT